MRIDLTKLQKWSASRKMLVSDMLKPSPFGGTTTIDVSEDELERISAFLRVPVSELLASENLSDLDRGVAIADRDEQYQRDEVRGGQKYYTYHHLAKTKSIPNLMALRITVHCRDPEKMVPNTHACPELVYVSVGPVRFHWAYEGVRLERQLKTGDSVYISPNTPHSFTCCSHAAEIIAFNF